MGDQPFDGKVAVVTGGASGIGRALASALHARGSRVVLADQDAPTLARTAEALGPGASPVVLDVRDRTAVQAAIDAVMAEHGRLDLLFNNAGISLGGQTHEMSGEYWDRILDVNLVGVVNGLLAAYPLMVEQGFGHIVNTASGAGLVGPPLTVAYSTTKHAVVGLSTTLRPEAAMHGVRVSVLCPGAVETPILDARPHGRSATPTRRRADGTRVPREVPPAAHAGQPFRRGSPAGCGAQPGGHRGARQHPDALAPPSTLTGDDRAGAPDDGRSGRALPAPGRP
jgi:NAD(P)-dependent dehydrogenase (short-subunit alcohol dehydrogenase family)